MRARVRRHNDFARRLADRIEASPSLELMAPVTLSTCCFRYRPAGLADRDSLNELNRKLIVQLHNEHHHVPSNTRLGHDFVLRACYINPRTTLEDVDGLIDSVERIGAELSSTVGFSGRT